MCVKKFLGCFPPRISCIVLAYAGIVSSVLVIGWFTYYFLEAVEEFDMAVARFNVTLTTDSYGLERTEKYDLERTENYGLERTENYDQEYEFQEEDTSELEFLLCLLVFSLEVAVFGCNFFVHGLFIVFSIFLAIGAHTNKRGLVKAYFVYGFFHFFFMLILASLHFFADLYLETALIVIADIFFAFCLCGVKGMMDIVNKGKVYNQLGGLQLLS